MFVLQRKLRKILHLHVSLSIFSYSGIFDDIVESMPPLIHINIACSEAALITREFTKTKPILAEKMERVKLDILTVNNVGSKNIDVYRI